VHVAGHGDLAEPGADAGEAAGSLMSSNVLKGPPETPIPDAIQQMLAGKRKRFYVVDAHGRLLGAVDRQTLLRSIAGVGQ
jgi:CBS domain-containing protein